ncbi:MAG: aspartate ammonia-lyase [Candidatus Micrarchaeota archaeon]|nr:aspartate ammonia-lyase [Candidatus Micrarchaeota archaeon]
MKARIEEDFIGKVEVPSEAYYGIFTVRASRNFQISGKRPPRQFIRMLALVKKSAAEANVATGSLPVKIGSALAKAASEVAEGKFDSQFILDAYTAGAGTPFNMNMNEVLANRAEEILGGKKGQYKLVHPNNHANMSQSSNDVIPAAIRLTLISLSAPLLHSAGELAAALDRKSRAFSKTIKVGRTHLMDAVPLTVGDELSAFSSALRLDAGRIEKAVESLRELNLGATAIGSGINTHPAYKRIVAKRVAHNTGIRVREGSNLFRLTSQASDFLEYSASLRGLAVTIHKLSNDLKLLSSGPNTAIGEYILPEVEPGSSIMPGKVNPSIPECAEMVSNRVFGNDQSVLMAAAGGQLQLNVQTPLILECLSESSVILANACGMLKAYCIDGLRVDKEKIRKHLDASLISITALAPYFGYPKMSQLVKRAQEEGKPIKQLVVSEKLLTEKQYDRLMSPSRLTRPSKKEKL